MAIEGRARNSRPLDDIGGGDAVISGLVKQLQECVVDTKLYFLLCEFALAIALQEVVLLQRVISIQFDTEHGILYRVQSIC